MPPEFEACESRSAPKTLVLDRRVAIVLFLVVVAAIAWGVFYALSFDRSKSQLRIGQLAPDLVIDGVHKPLGGQPTLLLFFTHTCSHCNNTRVTLDALKKRRPSLFSRVRVVMISEDGPDSSVSPTFATVVDEDRKTGSAYGVNHVPFLVSVDTHSTIRALHLGELDEHQEESLLNDLAN